VANHLGWKECREEGDVDNFNAEVNRVLWQKIWPDPLHRGSWDDTFWAPIQAPLRVLIQPLGEFTPYKFFRHVRSGPIYWGVIYLAIKIIRWWYFTCKHVSLF
jgi:hypothetical protein